MKRITINTNTKIKRSDSILRKLDWVPTTLIREPIYKIREQKIDIGNGSTYRFYLSRNKFPFFLLSQKLITMGAT